MCNLPTDENDPVFIEFADFEQRLLIKKYNFVMSTLYVKQTDVKWLINPVPKRGDLEMSFPPEEEISDSYAHKGQNYGVKPVPGYICDMYGVT